MKNNQVNPEKVTKPIQLLAAWLVGLILVNGSLLSSAVAIGTEHWTSSMLVVASVLNVPMFLGAIFMLQTKFRPELQEDSYYASYLDKRTNKLVEIKKSEGDDSLLLQEEVNKLKSIVPVKNSNWTNSIFGSWKVAVNDYLPDYNSIRESLKQHKIPVNEIFGKGNTKEPPENYIIAISEHVDSESVIYLLRAISDFNFDGYTYFDPIKEIDTDDIYLGSYGFEKNNIFPFNSDFYGIIKSEIDVADLKEFERNNII
ncbi:hypothetical protein [Photobacterium atrarenae]|uniref:Uncharacterized protein n=1 Tax=Photobacterium atrarenae TaxID=865757 RepID=A0ABY5GB51_9GAMM|nr:hypothetical protein [Photobacterium atrarenae]UTV26405.1 hypothetical protein NNL38_08420 [Photobacterium atrarenae]